MKPLKSVYVAAMAVLFVMLTVSCASISEQHYFKSIGERPNYFRLTVDGNSKWSSSRYIAGYYDERAIDLFFNELKIATASDKQDTSKLIEDDTTIPGSDVKLKPLGPEDGTFLMIMSTNADAVVDAIGQFAESNAITEAIANIANKPRIEAVTVAKASLSAEQTRYTAIAAEIDRLFSLVDREATDENVTEAAYLRILNAISRAVSSPQTFTSFENARIWLQTVQSGRIE